MTRPGRAGLWLVAGAVVVVALTGCGPAGREPPAASLTHPVVQSEVPRFVVVGWSRDGRAGVFFSGGVCGAGDERPGLYLVTLDGAREFVTDDVSDIESWQASHS
jgi:hypothetical protein